MTQKEQITNIEQRVQALEQKLAKLVRTERSQQSSSDAKPLPNRRQERLAKLDMEKDLVTTTGETFFNPIWNGTNPKYIEGKGGIVGDGKQYAGEGNPELVAPLLELKKRLKNNPEFGTGNNRIEVAQTWKETDDNKFGWEVDQCWIDAEGFEILDEYVIVTEVDKFNNPIKGYFVDFSNQKGVESDS